MSSFSLTQSRYGKGLVRLVKVDRSSSQQRLKELTVQVLLEGDFENSYTKGDNSLVIPTDTVKNTIYVLAKENPIYSIEEFGIYIVKHFLNMYSHVEKVHISIEEHLWNRIKIEGKEHPFSFEKPGMEKRITEILGSRKNILIESGIKDLVVLKTTGSGFENFHKCKYTTLKETNDRILSTSVFTKWKYDPSRIGMINFNHIYETSRQKFLTIFSNEYSKVVQETLYLVGRKILEQFSEIESIFFRLPNIHVFIYDLSPFGLDNTNEVYRPFSDPTGILEGTISRNKAKL